MKKIKLEEVRREKEGIEQREKDEAKKKQQLQLYYKKIVKENLF